MRKKLSCKCEFILIALSYDSYVTGRSGVNPSENGLRADDDGNGGKYDVDGVDDGDKII